VPGATAEECVGRDEEGIGALAREPAGAAASAAFLALRAVSQASCLVAKSFASASTVSAGDESSTRPPATRMPPRG
jgi:hypothetical protein